MDSVYEFKISTKKWLMASVYQFQKSTKKSAKGHKYRKYKNLQKKFAKACNYRKNLPKSLLELLSMESTKSLLKDISLANLQKSLLKLVTNEKSRNKSANSYSIRTSKISTKKSAKACNYGKIYKKSDNSCSLRTTGLRSTKKSAKACKYGKSTKKSANVTVLETRFKIYEKVC